MTRAITALALVLIGIGPIYAQQGDSDSFEKNSIAFRTALHYDASLQTPLNQLVELYREAGRQDELVALYQAHIAQYPADHGAKAVLIQILESLKQATALDLARQALAAHPDQAFLHYLHFHVSGELDSLSQAINLETRADRKLSWIDTLLEKSTTQEQRQLAVPHLTALREALGADTDSLISLAEKLFRFGFFEVGLELVSEIIPAITDPERTIDLQILAAKFEAASDKARQADQRLGNLLGKLAPDYWRRSEISKLRMQLLDNDGDRNSMLAVSEERYLSEPKNAEAAIDYADALNGAGLREQASEILFEASQRLPHVLVLEQRALEALDQQGKTELILVLLRDRLAEYPERTDLRSRLVRTLYLKGALDKAKSEATLYLDGLDSAESVEAQVELARYLERNQLPNQAIDHLTAALALAPERLSLRTELADLHLELDNQDQAQKIIKEATSLSAGPDEFIEFTDFLLSKGFLPEALSAVQDRLSSNPESLNLATKLVTIYGKVGNYTAGQQLHQNAKEWLASDTDYREWLEAGLGFSQEFDRSAAFFENEYAEYLETTSGTLTEPQLDRFLILCEIGREHRQRERVAELLRSQLDSASLSANLSLKIRKALVETLGDDPNYSLEVESQLSELLKTDLTRADEYRLRLGKLYFLNQRTDLARSLFEQARPENVEEQLVLEAAYPIFEEFGMREKAAGALKQLTVIKPTNLQFRETLLNLLAGARDESGFRTTIRRLKEDAEQLSLSEDSRIDLDQYLADSFWRSISAELGVSAFAEVLSLLDQLEQELEMTKDHLWATWTRAYVYNQLSRETPRDEAIKAFTNKAAENRLKAVPFPDGLVISLSAAKRLLKREPAEASLQLARPPLLEVDALKWGFEISPARSIVQVASAGSHIIVLDDFQNLYGINAKTGKLSWQHTTPRTGTVFASVGGFQAHLPSPRFQTSDSGRLYLHRSGDIQCLDSTDGTMIWSAKLNHHATGSPQSFEIGYRSNQLLVYEAGEEQVSALHAENGKVLWSTNLGARKSVLDARSRAAFGDSYSFFHGSHPTVLDSLTGEVVWKVQTEELRSFPLLIRSTTQSQPMASSNTVQYLDPSGSAPLTFSTSPSAFVAPALKWWQNRRERNSNASAHFVGNRLLLKSSKEVTALSVELPVSARRFELGGTFLGASNSKAAFLESATATILETKTGSTYPIPLPGEGNGFEPFVDGLHLYSHQRDQLEIWKLTTGQKLVTRMLPKTLFSYSQQYLQSQTQPAPLTSSASLSSPPLSGRSFISNDLMIMRIGNRAIAAIGSTSAIASN